MITPSPSKDKHVEEHDATCTELRALGSGSGPNVKTTRVKRQEPTANPTEAPRLFCGPRVLPTASWGLRYGYRWPKGYVSARQPRAEPLRHAAHPCRRLAVPSAKCGPGFRLNQEARQDEQCRRGSRDGRRWAVLAAPGDHS